MSNSNDNITQVAGAMQEKSCNRQTAAVVASRSATRLSFDTQGRSPLGPTHPGVTTPDAGAFAHQRPAARGGRLSPSDGSPPLGYSTARQINHLEVKK
jgi:hypothetical protein